MPHVSIKMKVGSVFKKFVAYVEEVMEGPTVSVNYKDACRTIPGDVIKIKGGDDIKNKSESEVTVLKGKYNPKKIKTYTNEELSTGIVPLEDIKTSLTEADRYAAELRAMIGEIEGEGTP